MISVIEVTVSVVAYFLRPISLNDRLISSDRSLNAENLVTIFSVTKYTVTEYLAIGFQNLYRSKKILVKFD